MPRRLTAFLLAGALQVVALVLAHELVFLARYGSRYGEALAHAGHGSAWDGAVRTVLVFAVALLAAGGLRLWWLGTLVRRGGDQALRDPHRTTAGRLELRALGDAWLRTGSRTALLGTALLTVQENVERAGIGQPIPGPGILLSAEYAGGLWIALAVGLLVGLVAALFEWRHRALLARLRSLRAPLPRGSARAPRRSGLTARPSIESVIGRRSALRAPPAGAAA